LTHYFRKGRIGAKKLLSLTIKGLTLEFITYSSLFSGSEIDLGTRLLLEHVEVPSSGVVLDIGCGYGVIGITIAKLNPRLRVYMTDINPLAVKIAKYNAKLNNVSDRVIVLRGDRYEPVKNMVFDAIYSNPPLSAGMKIVEDIVLNAIKYLKRNGHAEFVLARGGEYLARRAKEIYSEVVVLRKKGYILLKLKP
jgi:16S rRNA (guanine1207-N2)-methyltransferase